jgi:hypothetical protein
VSSRSGTLAKMRARSSVAHDFSGLAFLPASFNFCPNARDLLLLQILAVSKKPKPLSHHLACALVEATLDSRVDELLEFGRQGNVFCTAFI